MTQVLHAAAVEERRKQVSVQNPDFDFSVRQSRQGLHVIGPGEFPRLTLLRVGVQYECLDAVYCVAGVDCWDGGDFRFVVPL